MDNKKEIIPLSLTNDYSDVPSWYVLAVACAIRLLRGHQRAWRLLHA